MTITDPNATAADLMAMLFHFAYANEKHDCDPDGFTPTECAPCTGCNHGECRHAGQPFPTPIDKTGLTGEALKAVQLAELAAINAAITASPCDVDGCDCTRMRCGDECLDCSGEGSTEDERTGRTYICRDCRGTGVIV